VWGICIARDYIASGAKTHAEAVQLALDYYRAETRTGKERVTNADDAERMLKSAQVEEQCRRLETMLDSMGGAVDAINFHFYEDYDVMHFVTDWIAQRTERAGYSPALVTNEIGQRGPDETFAEGSGQAESVFKKMVTASALRVRAAIWFSADTINTAAPAPDKVGLFGSGGTLRAAARTFQLVARTLADYRFQSALFDGPALYHYVFVDGQGAPTLEALWSEDAGLPLALTAPPGATQAVVTDYAGQTRTLPVSGGSVALTLTAPVFVQWK
jgi:hypothetical protein